MPSLGDDDFHAALPVTSPKVSICNYRFACWFAYANPVPYQDGITHFKFKVSSCRTAFIFTNQNSPGLKGISAFGTVEFSVYLIVLAFFNTSEAMDNFAEDIQGLFNILLCVSKRDTPRFGLDRK